MIKLESGRQSVGIDIHSGFKHEQNTWMFCQNGYQSTGVQISAKQFDMLRELINKPEIVEFYERLKGADSE